MGSIKRIICILFLSVLCETFAVGTLTSPIDADTCNCTYVDRSFHRLLSRQKRVIIFPPGAIIIITMSMTKVLPDGRPRGLQLSLELDQIHPLPEELDWWVPKFTEHASKRVDDVLGEHRHPQEYVFPKGNHFSYKLDEPNKFSNRFRPIYYPEFTSHKEWYTSHPDMFWKANRKWSTPENYPKLTQSSYDATPSTTHHQRRPDYSWKDYHGHRERREIYRKLETMGTIFSHDMRSCILRTICETQHYLLPPGVSMIQDIVRILFTSPYHDDFADDYNQAADLNGAENCHEMYKASCPLSILEHFLHGERAI